MKPSTGFGSWAGGGGAASATWFAPRRASREPESSRRPQWEKATLVTSFVCPTNSSAPFPVLPGFVTILAPLAAIGPAAAAVAAVTTPAAGDAAVGASTIATAAVSAAVSAVSVVVSAAVSLSAVSEEDAAPRGAADGAGSTYQRKR